MASLTCPATSRQHQDQASCPLGFRGAAPKHCPEPSSWVGSSNLIYRPRPRLEQVWLEKHEKFWKLMTFQWLCIIHHPGHSYERQPSFFKWPHHHPSPPPPSEMLLYESTSKKQHWGRAVGENIWFPGYSPKCRVRFPLTRLVPSDGVRTELRLFQSRNRNGEKLADRA